MTMTCPTAFPVAVIVALTAAGADGQITPDRLYYGVGRAMPMTVRAPAGTTGELTIQLLAPGTAEVVASAPVKAGGVDFSALFPDLWKTEEAPRLLYAQLAAGDTRVGPAVVLQPLTTPKYARFDPRAPRQWSWQEPQQKSAAGYRAWVNQSVVLQTTQGDVEFMMRPDVAPNTAFNFIQLVQGGFYTDIEFHRIMKWREGKPSILQAGDPSGTGEGGPGYMILLEDSTLPHEFGVISMARTPHWDSAGSQFFICLDREAVVNLDGNYTSFGQAITGADVLAKIGATECDAATGKPTGEAPKITSAKLVDAKPYSGVPPFLTAPGAGDDTPPR